MINTAFFTPANFIIIGILSTLFVMLTNFAFDKFIK